MMKENRKNNQRKKSQVVWILIFLKKLRLKRNRQNLKKKEMTLERKTWSYSQNTNIAPSVISNSLSDANTAKFVTNALQLMITIAHGQPTVQGKGIGFGFIGTFNSNSYNQHLHLLFVRKFSLEITKTKTCLEMENRCF